MSETVLRVEDLHKSFGRSQVLKGVDLLVPSGAVVGLLGANGAGKSTLLKCALGLLRGSSGSIRILDEDPWELSDQAKARLGYVPQVVKLYPWMKVRQVVDYTGAFYPNWNDDRCTELLNLWELGPNERVKDLSTGQLQRLGIVLAFGHKPELLILDEPAASLDPKGRRALMRSILEMTSDGESTVVFSTHITSDLERVASHVAMLRDGVVDYFGELDDLKDNVKRVRVSARGELPSSFDMPRSLRTEVSGTTAIAAVASIDDTTIQELQREWDADVAVEDLNLEEIFLEMDDA